MITSIKITGFKSFWDFEMEFKPFTVIAGLNASGKSNLFDALRLLAAIAESETLQQAFRQQRGELQELFTTFADGSQTDKMHFEIEMLVPVEVIDDWGRKETLKWTRLRYTLTLQRFVDDIGLMGVEVIEESLSAIKKGEDRWIRNIPASAVELCRPKGPGRTTPFISTNQQEGYPTAVLHQDGTSGKGRPRVLNRATRTMLSSVNSVDFPHALAARQEMRSWRFLQLNPEDLRLPTSKTKGGDVIGATGQNLAAVLYRIKQTDPHALLHIARRLHEFVPTFVDVDVRDDSENNQFVIELCDSDGTVSTSRVLSDGTLRILALCILLYDSRHQGLLCFEEPENGIHPQRIPSMASLLGDLAVDFRKGIHQLRQVIVNTHSPRFVATMQHWRSDPRAMVAMSRTASRTIQVDGSRRRLHCTGISPVMIENDQYTIPLSEPERRLTTTMLADYLEYSDQKGSTFLQD